MIKKSLMAILLLGGCISGAASKISDETLLRCGPMTENPVIDGIISSEEKSVTSPNYGFMSSGTKLLTLRYGMYYFGYTADGIYFAARVSIPPKPQKLTERDTLQLLLLPPGAQKPFEFTITPTGKHNIPNGGKVAFRYVPGVVDYGVECMETEVFIPFSVLGVKKIENGKAWGLQMIRNFQSQPETGLWHWSLNPKELGTFIPDASMPICGVKDFGFKEDHRPRANYQFIYRYFNRNSKTIKVESDSILYYGQGTSKLDDKPEDCLEIKTKKFNRATTLKPNESVHQNYLVYAVWPGTVNTLKCNLSVNGTPVYRRVLRWDYSKGEKWVDGEGLPSLQSAFYPSYNNRLLVKLSRNKTRRMVSGKVTVEDSSGKVWFTYTPEINGYLKNFELDTNLPPLPVGKYFVRFTGKDKSGKVYTDERTFSVAKFPWQELNLGMDKVIVPPFKPLRVNENEVHALLTGYRAGNGIWDAVYAEGENILAAPVELIINGERFQTGKPEFTMKEDHRVVIKIPAVWKDLKLTIIQDYDYDGFAIVTFKFEPGKRIMVNSLTLNIPLKNKYVTLLNYTRRGKDKRNGPAPDLFVPAGEGIIWDSVEATGKAERYPAPVQPYFWFGGTKKGFCWLSESIRYWSIDKRSPVQTLTRKGDVITFSVNIVNKPVEWDKAFSFKMAFQPTPVKPVYEKFRDAAQNMFQYKCPKNATPVAMHNGVTLSGLYNISEICFANNDNSIQKFLIDNLGKKTDPNVYRKVVKDYFDRNQKWLEDRDYPVQTLRSTWGLWWRHVGMKYLARYNNPMLISCFWPEWEMYKAEWQAHPYPWENYFSEYACYQPKSRIDYLLYIVKQNIDAGFSGVFYDCFHDGGTFNYVVNEGAYKKPDGTVQFSLTQALAWREIVKRTATMLYVNNKMIDNERPWVDIHGTLGHIVPVFSFATTTITLERSGGGGEFQDRIPEGFVLADMLALQSGVFPIPIVSTFTGSKERREQELKTLFAVMCAYGFFDLHDAGIVYQKWFENAWNAVFDFGFGKPGNRQYFYYNNEKMPVTHNGKNVRMNLSVKKNSVLVMAGNLGGEEVVTFDASGLGWDKLEFFDAVSNKSLGSGKTLTQKISRRGHTLIRIDKK